MRKHFANRKRVLANSPSYLQPIRLQTFWTRGLDLDQICWVKIHCRADRDSIQIEFDNVTTLVLSPSYKKALENFFGSYENGKLVNEQGRETFREKKRFVDDFLPLAMGYDYKVILTHPLITGIEISKDFQFAKVDFQLDESGLQSILRKEKSKWVILGTKTVWIE